MKPEYTATELAAALGVRRQALNKSATKKRWPYRDAPNPKGGGSQRLYALADLPPDVQARIVDHSKKAGALVPAHVAPQPIQKANDTQPTTVPALPQPTSVAPPRKIIIPERADDIGLAKYNLVETWRNVVDGQPYGRKIEATEAFLLAYNSGQCLRRVFERVGAIRESALRDMDKRLRESAAENRGHEDYRVLCDGRGGWRKHGTTHWRRRNLSNDAKEAFLGCWLHPDQPTVSLAIRAARKALELRGIIEQADDRTWRRWLEDWSKRSQHVIVLAREGEKAYRDKVGPYITRDDALLEPGQVLIADGHDLNFEILHPYTGKPARLKLIVFFDWASRMPVGWQIMPTESTVAIHAALRNAVTNLGKIPQIVYLDNGKAFKAKVFTDTDPDLTQLSGLYARLGIAVMFAQPYNARAKILERWFGTLNEQFERLMPTYTGACIGDKPAWRLRNEKFHKASHDKRTGGWVPDIREAAHLISLYIDWYGQQEHSGIHYRKPAEVFASGRGPGIDPVELDEKFLWTKPRVTPRRCRVQLFTVEYEADCLHGYDEDVMVRYDCSDLSQVWIHALDGTFLGEALPVQALHPAAKLLGDQVGVDEVKAAVERQRRLAKQTRQNLLTLGAPSTQVDALDALPWRQKAAVLPGGKSDEAERREIEAPLPEAERARLELVVSRAEAEAETERERPPELERPEGYRTPLDRYEWLWRTRFEHKGKLTHEEEAFMAWFESTMEFGEFRQRFEDLKLLYMDQ